MIYQLTFSLQLREESSASGSERQTHSMGLCSHLYRRVQSFNLMTWLIDFTLVSHRIPQNPVDLWIKRKSTCLQWEGFISLVNTSPAILMAGEFLTGLMHKKSKNREQLWEQTFNKWTAAAWERGKGMLPLQSRFLLWSSAPPGWWSSAHFVVYWGGKASNMKIMLFPS